MQSNKILRAKEAAKLLGVGKTKFYELTKDSSFPARIKLSRLITGWSEGQLIEWKQINSKKSN